MISGRHFWSASNSHAFPPLKVLLYFFVLFCGLVVIGLFNAWLVTHPARLESGLTPADYGLPFEEVRMTARDGVFIAGWFIPAPAPAKPALLLLHGYPAEKGDLLFSAKALHEDFHLLLIDFRYFGASGGSVTTLGTKEPLDVAAALDYLELRGFRRVGVFGFSLGGAVAIVTAAQDTRIAALAAYAAFADLGLLARHVYARLPVIREALIPLMQFWARALWDIDTGFAPKKHAGRLRIPVLIIHTQRDGQIPFSHAELLREALRENERAAFYFPDSGAHGALPGDLEERVRQFFLERL